MNKSDAIATLNRPGGQPAAEYAELKRLVKQQNVTDRQPLYYSITIATILAIYVASFVAIILLDNLWLLLVDAAIMGFAFTHMGFLGHDAGHRQIFIKSRFNDITSLSVAFLMGTGRSWWINQHNEHHSNPNDLDLDPHTAIPILAYSQKVASQKKGILRLIIRYQAIYFFPILVGEGLGMRFAAIQYMLKSKMKYPVLEPVLMGLHFVIYFAMLAVFLEPVHAVLFFVVHQACFGFYMGSIFAPNHKGMPTITKESKLDFIRRQVLTSRNISPGILTDFWYGGLNYQIEHHLFPTIPRNKLRETRKVVKQFCRDHSIPYHETNVFQAQWEILSSLHEFSAPLRAKSS